MEVKNSSAPQWRTVVLDAVVLDAVVLDAVVLDAALLYVHKWMDTVDGLCPSRFSS